jgi:hypothetical protein
MRPLIITSGGAPAKVIRANKSEIKRISNCMLLDTSLADVKELGPIEKNNPGYFIMNKGLDDNIFSKYTGIAIGCSIVSSEGDGEAAQGRKGINRQKEDFILAFALDDKLGISERIWSTIEQQKLRLNTDYLLFIAGLGGGTGSGSINSIANRFYKATEGQDDKAFLGSKHVVVGILPSFKENEQGEDVNRLRFNTVWALYDMLRPVKRPNPLILLDNEAMDKANSRPTKPIMNIISMLSDWRPDKDGGDFFTKYGTKTMAPYYGCIEKPLLRMITKEDIDRSLRNIVVGQKEINSNEDSLGRWYLTISQNDIDNSQNGGNDSNSDSNTTIEKGSIYILTKGLPVDLRSYLRSEVGRLLRFDDSKMESVVMEWPLINTPGKAEFLLLMMFQSPMQIGRIKDMIICVQKLVRGKKKMLEKSFDHITRDDTRVVLNNFVHEMLSSMDPATNKDPRFMPKHEIKFFGDCFELVAYKEIDPQPKSSPPSDPSEPKGENGAVSGEPPQSSSGSDQQATSPAVQPPDEQPVGGKQADQPS